MNLFLDVSLKNLLKPKLSIRKTFEIKRLFIISL